MIQMIANEGFPRYRAIADHAVLIEFGEKIDDDIHSRVVSLDDALRESELLGFLEAVPAYASLLVSFDPLATNHRTVIDHVATLIEAAKTSTSAQTFRTVEVCYDPDLAPDLKAVAEATGLSPDEVINAHLCGDYKVFMYGFAPGYAYLAGVPQMIQRPRKPAAVRGVHAGSVLIAGPQCLVSTLTMPTGWWIIGRSPTRIFDRQNDERPFLFDVGDTVSFRRISRAAFDSGASQ
jgi:inhibitor of KinA